MSAVGAFGGDGIMNPRRFVAVAAALCGTVILAGWVVAWLAGFGSAGIENTGTVPIEDRRTPSLIADAELADASQATAMGNAANADVSIEDRRTPSLTADAELADAPQATAMGNAAVAKANVATAAESVTGTATDTTAASNEPASIVEATLPDSSRTPPP